MIEAIRSIPANSTNLLNRIGSSVTDSKIYKLAKSLFTKIGEFISTCMKFCKERFNAFKEKVSPSHQQHEKRHVRQEYLDDDYNNAIEMQELPLLSNSNASSAHPSLPLVPFAVNSSDAPSAPPSLAMVPYLDLKKHILSKFINQSGNEKTNLQSPRHAGVALFLRGMGPRAEQFPFLKSFSLQNPIQALQFPILAQLQRDALADRGQNHHRLLNT
jgi:hypothetical protein